MFDSYHVHRPPNVTINTKIEQKPHDTADAARLYGELKRKTEKEVANATVQTLGAANEVRVVSVATHQDMMWEKSFMRLVFSINGTLFDIVCESDPLAMRKKIYECVMQEVFEQAIEKMTYSDKSVLLKKVK